MSGEITVRIGVRRPNLPLPEFLSLVAADGTFRTRRGAYILAFGDGHDQRSGDWRSDRAVVSAVRSHLSRGDPVRGAWVFWEAHALKVTVEGEAVWLFSPGEVPRLGGRVPDLAWVFARVCPALAALDAAVVSAAADVE